MSYIHKIFLKFLHFQFILVSKFGWLEFSFNVNWKIIYVIDGLNNNKITFYSFGL